MSSVTDKFFFPPIISHATIRGTIYKISCEQEKEYHMYRAAQTRYDFGKKPEGFSEDKVIDGKDRLAIPGLVNCHTHSYMSFMRNVADDLSFMDWLFGTIDPLEGKLVPEDAYWGAKLAIMEMMRCGTTTFSDMQMHIHQTTRAVKETGMRAVIGRGLVGGMACLFLQSPYLPEIHPVVFQFL